MKAKIIEETGGWAGPWRDRNGWKGRGKRWNGQEWIVVDGNDKRRKMM